MTLTTLILGGIVVLISVGLLAMMFMKSNQVNLTGKTEDKPEWMHSAPPKETIKATRADDKGVTLLDHDAGEKLAAPFAEQIEDILRAKLESDPFNKFEIDLFLFHFKEHNSECIKYIKSIETKSNSMSDVDTFDILKIRSNK